MSLKEIARLSGASVSTVSRVLNQPDYRCSDPILQDRIWQLANEMHYLPNSAARQLKAGPPAPTSSLVVDVFLTRFQTLDDDIFFRELFDILREKLMQNYCHLGQILTLPDMIKRSKNLSLFPPAKESPDGLIILGKCPAELLAFLKKQYLHLIGIDRNPTSFDYDEVFCDGSMASQLAMDYLISLGHKKIAYIGDCSYEARYIGYHQSLMAHKIPLDYSNVYPILQTRQEGRQVMQVILEKPARPTAIFCANDSTALGVLDALKTTRHKGYRPSVISIDNIREAENALLTTINVPKRELAHHAVMLLLVRIQGGHKEIVRIELQGKLVVRDSCSFCVE